jgi:glycosyltransferase involved in cell wall biosynthesis
MQKSVATPASTAEPRATSGGPRLGRPGGRRYAPASMRIALEVTSACRPQRTGIGRYIAELVRALVREAPRHEYHLLNRLSRWPSRRLRLFSPGVRQGWIQEGFLPLDQRADVLHGLDARVPLWREPVRIATVHDVFALHLDGVAPDDFARKKRERYAELARRCDRLIADSASTRDNFLSRIDYPEDRVHVVHLGVDERFDVDATLVGAVELHRFGVRTPYLLFVGDISRRKNLPRMLAAYASSPVRHTHRLVIAGRDAFRSEETYEEIRRLGIAQRVVLPGFVPDELLPQLYAHASCLLFAALYEGFGLPALEAMAAGTPVVGGTEGALGEVTAGRAELVDPYDVDAIRAGIERALDWDEERRLEARHHARSLTWSRCAQQTLRVYGEAVAARA